jgi:two-component system, OmpR family, response regulator RegX3
MRIALLEDDPSQTELLTHWLRTAGHHVRAFEQGAELLSAFAQESFDAVLLEWHLPDLSGIDVLRELRQRLHATVPVIFCTARDQEEDVVKALKAGADDYLVKPLRRAELLARLESVNRRGRGVPLEIELLEVGVFRVNCQTRSITRDNKPVELTAKDFDLAAVLLNNVGRLLSRGRLLETIWGQKAARSSSRSLDTHISRVRTKLKLKPEYGWRLAAVYGYGYRLDQLTAPAPEAHQDEPKAS